MRCPHLPSSIDSLLFSFRPCFTAPTHEAFAALVLGWLLSEGPHTLSGALLAVRRLGLWTRHHAGFYRLLARARWCADEVGAVLLGLLLPFLPQEIDVAVDDTLCRRTGPQVFGLGMHHDATAGSYGGSGGRRVALACGHSWVVLSIWVPLPWGLGRGVAVPILFRLYRAKRRCPAAHYRKRTELAREMLAVLLSRLPEGRRVHVTGDREYGCRTLIHDLEPRAHFSGAMPLDAWLLEAQTKVWNRKGRPPTWGARRPSPAETASDRRQPWQTTTTTLYGREVTLKIKTFVACWPRVLGRRLVRVMLTRDPSGRLGDRAYFSTQIDLPAEQILVRYARRWALEVTFAAAKQSLGLEQPRNGWWRRPHGRRRPWGRPGSEERGGRGRLAAERTVPLIGIAYGLVVAWYLRNGQAEDDVARARRLRPWDRAKATPAFADMLAALRRTLWQHRLSAQALPDRLRRKLVGLLQGLTGAA